MDDQSQHIEPLPEATTQRETSLTQSTQSAIQFSSQSIVPSGPQLRHDDSTGSGTVDGGPHRDDGEELSLDDDDLGEFMDQFLAGRDLA